MNVIVTGTFCDCAAAEAFAKNIESIIDQDNHVVDIQSVGATLVVSIAQREQLTIPAPDPEDVAAEIPADVAGFEIELSTPTADVAMDNPPSMDNPSEPLPVEEPPVELAKEPEVPQEPIITLTDLGNRCVVSLNSGLSIPTVMDFGLQNTQLEVMSQVTRGQHNDCVVFWYGGMMYTLPRATPNEVGIFNPQHQLGDNTIRVLINSAEPAAPLMAYYVDVVYVEGAEQERLVFGADTIIQK